MSKWVIENIVVRDAMHFVSTPKKEFKPRFIAENGDVKYLVIQNNRLLERFLVSPMNIICTGDLRMYFMEKYSYVVVSSKDILDVVYNFETSKKEDNTLLNCIVEDRVEIVKRVIDSGKEYDIDMLAGAAIYSISAVGQKTFYNSNYTRDFPFEEYIPELNSETTSTEVLIRSYMDRMKNAGMRF